MTAKEFEKWFVASGLSRDDAAQMFGRTSRTIDAWRKGRTPVPDYAIIIING